LDERKEKKKKRKGGERVGLQKLEFFKKEKKTDSARGGEKK